RPPVRGLAGSAVPLRSRPLGPAAVRGMVAGRFGRAGDPEFLQVCEEVSGGVPSVLRAVLDEVVAAGGGPVAACIPAVRSARP
ncbi:hypothetical protein, partial [Pseudonocardia sp. SID8383]